MDKLKLNNGKDIFVWRGKIKYWTTHGNNREIMGGTYDG
jgi:hypothetical protein